MLDRSSSRMRQRQHVTSCAMQSTARKPYGAGSTLPHGCRNAPSAWTRSSRAANEVRVSRKCSDVENNRNWMRLAATGTSFGVPTFMASSMRERGIERQARCPVFHSFPFDCVRGGAALDRRITTPDKIDQINACCQTSSCWTAKCSEASLECWTFQQWPPSLRSPFSTGYRSNSNSSSTRPTSPSASRSGGRQAEWQLCRLLQGAYGAARCFDVLSLLLLPLPLDRTWCVPAST